MAYNQYNSERKPDIPRLTKDEIMDVIYDMKIKDKHTDPFIENWLMNESGYNYGRTYAYELIKDTNTYIRTLRNRLNTHTLDDVLSDLEAQKQAANERGEHRLVFDIQKEINKVAGHYKGKEDSGDDIIFTVKLGS